MEIRPFRAFRYDPAVVGDVGKCIAPPYDVITAEQQEQLYSKSEYNIVRIIRGKTNADDNGQNNVYTRAAAYLNRWIADGVLKQDPTDAIYGYVQDFDVAGRRCQRLTFIALGRLEEFGKSVRPHEQILEKPMLDRLNLKRATAARFGLVFMLYEDPQKVADHIIARAAEGPALLDCTDEQGVRHRLFAVTEPADVQAIAEMMKDKSCIIADGHHRYTTGLSYAKESPNPAARYQMLAFTNTCQDGLIVLATHRLVGNLPQFSMEKLLAGLQKDFTLLEFNVADAGSKEHTRLQMLERMAAEHKQDRSAFGIYGGSGVFYVAILKDRSVMDEVAGDMSRAWRQLDVSVLQKLVLEKLLGIDEAKLAKGQHLSYVKDTPSAVEHSIAAVDQGQKQVAFFLNPVKIEQLKQVTEAGERMPQKSTYFYPKLYTGLTIQKL